MAAIATLAVVVVTAAGCGAATLKSDEVIDTLELSKPEGRDTYSVAGDPFCEIDSDVLTGAEEVALAKKSKKTRRLLVTNSAGDVGVVGVAPFGGECKARVVAGMRQIE